MTEQQLSGNIEIPLDSTPKRGMNLSSLSLSNLSVREIFRKSREGVQPWREFLNTTKFKVPKSVAPIGSRIIKNIEHFQSNYLFVFVGLVLFCILTSPLLLIAIGACFGACYIISLKNQEKKLAILGREISLPQQYAVVGVISFPLFWLAGAGSAVFWMIGASFFVIMLHAAMYDSSEEADEENLLQMEDV